jgi:hypothetical protein
VISEATEEAVRTIAKQALRSKDLARQSGQPEGRATYLDCRGSLQLPSPRESAREGIPGPGSTADLLKEAGRIVQELAGESRRNWETRARNQAMRVMHVASEAYKSLSSHQRTIQNCRENEKELESELRA